MAKTFTYELIKDKGTKCESCPMVFRGNRGCKTTFKKMFGEPCSDVSVVFAPRKSNSKPKVRTHKYDPSRVMELAVAHTGAERDVFAKRKEGKRIRMSGNERLAVQIACRILYEDRYIYREISEFTNIHMVQVFRYNNEFIDDIAYCKSAFNTYISIKKILSSEYEAQKEG